MGPAAPAEAGEFARGWPIVLCGFIGMAVQACAYLSLGVMMIPLSAAFGWTRTEIVAVAPLSAILAPFVAPVTGTLIDRWGPRRVALCGFAVNAAAVAALASLGPNILGLWAIWLVIAASTFPIGALVWTAAVTSGFARRRGLALGIVLSGMGLAVAVTPLFLSWATATLGWRGAYAALGGLVLIFGWGTAFIGFRPPRASAGRADLAAAAPGLARGEAMRTRRFWQLGLVLLIASGAVGVLAIHLQPMLRDRGATMLAAAAVAAAFGPAQIVGRLGGGYLLDRLPATAVGATVLILPLAGCLVLLSGAGGAVGWLVPLCFGLAAGLELDLGTYLAGRYFGAASFGTVFSTLFVFHVVGYTFSPLLAAYLRDVTGSYHDVLIAIAVMLPVAAYLTATLGPYPHPATPE